LGEGKSKKVLPQRFCVHLQEFIKENIFVIQFIKDFSL